MAERIDPDALQGLFEGRTRGGDAALLLPLARVAADLRQLMPPAPDGETGARIAADFARVRSGGGLGWRAWLLGWLGAGPRPRTFADRLAAGVLTLAVTGGGGTAAGGGDPVAIVRDAAQLTGSAIQNLDPRQSGTTTTTATSTPAPSATPVPSQTPAPASATAQPSATPRSDDKSDDHSDDEEDTKDDSSGRKISDDGEDSS